MKIGELVESYIPKINAFCEEDIDEFEKLMDIDYCKKTFKINYPFYKKVDDLSQKEHVRYWTSLYIVRGKTVRVTSQWVEDPHRPKFINYLISKKIAKKEDFNDDRLQELSNETNKSPVKKTLSSNDRYRGNAIGKGSNLLVRNILSRLGTEQFNEQDWDETKQYFQNCCAYCGKQTEKLEMEHAIPINKKSLGEHRLGNLVPSCSPCNASKHSQHFEAFLKDDNAKIDIIKAYMESKNYVPLGDNEQVRVILEMAYDEVSKVAERYITILNQLFSK